MTTFGRRLLRGLLVGATVVLVFGAWVATTRPLAPSISSVAVESAEPGLRPLPRAQGVPGPASKLPGPVGIRIADIRVDHGVVPVGVETDGSLEVPAVGEVGWYRFGSNAGEPGSTVLAAHVAFDGVDGVFRHLSSVSAGAEIELDLADGGVARYRVVEMAEYGKAELPVDALFAESGDDRLVLITCGGSFNPQLRSYDANVVVHAVPIME